MRMLAILFMVMLAFGVPVATMCEAPQGIVSPPVINIPYGGKIMTDINLSDDDVLGIVKQTLPVIVKTIKTPISEKKISANELALIEKLDIDKLAQAISGVKNLRMIVAIFGKAAKAEQILKQMNAGVVKTGGFSRFVGPIGIGMESVEVFSQENNSGYIAFMYVAREHSLIAVRVVGPVDVPKLVDLVSKISR